jgi:hypothetical protein
LINRFAEPGSSNGFCAHAVLPFFCGRLNPQKNNVKFQSFDLSR